jgi:hypothetical protein
MMDITVISIFYVKDSFEAASSFLPVNNQTIPRGRGKRGDTAKIMERAGSKSSARNSNGRQN